MSHPRAKSLDCVTNIEQSPVLEDLKKLTRLSSSCKKYFKSSCNHVLKITNQDSRFNPPIENCKAWVVVLGQSHQFRRQGIMILNRLLQVSYLILNVSMFYNQSSPQRALLILKTLEQSLNLSVLVTVKVTMRTPKNKTAFAICKKTFDEGISKKCTSPFFMPKASTRKVKY